MDSATEHPARQHDQEPQPDLGEAARATPAQPEPEEYPQAIGDDYPGWGIRHENGQWIAWCPAVTVHAASAAGLRAAIERAIGVDDD